MSDPSASPPRYLRTDEAGQVLGLSGRTLEKHRSFGTGPTYRKIGGLVVYTADDLHAWADAGKRSSTSVRPTIPAWRMAPPNKCL